MDFTQLISSRESVRDYDPARPLDDATLRAILDAGRLAPSAANRQPWRFIVVSSPAVLAEVRRCYHKPWFHDAPHVLAVVGDRGRCWVRECDRYSALETDCAIAMDHMVLAAENAGVATCWIAAFDPGILRSALNLREHETVFAITPLGYPRQGFTKKNDKKRKPLHEVSEIL